LLARFRVRACVVLLLLAACDATPAVPALPDAAPDAPAGLDAAEFDGAPAATDWRDQVIYLAMTDRFVNGDRSNDALGLPNCLDLADPQKFHGGDFAGLASHLDYVRAVGATALWVTPVYKQATRDAARCGYHGYWADFVDPDDGAVEPRLGMQADLDTLVASAHANGLQFILDMVVNHAGDGARIATQHPDWFHDPATCASLGDPAVYCPYRAGVHDFAQEKPEVAAYLDAVGAGWVRRVALDGIRMDTAKYVLPSFFHDSWIPAVRAERPLFLVAEVFDESGAAALKPYLDAGFDSAFNFPLRRALVNSFGHAGSVDPVAAAVQDDVATLGLARTQRITNMLDNHDVPRFVNEPGATVSVAEIARRYHLALVALFTLPGIPQLYMGDELGLYGAGDPDNRRDFPAWAFAQDGRGMTHPTQAVATAQTTFALVQKLAALRAQLQPLRRGDYRELWRQNGAANPNVFAFSRDDVIVVINAGTAATLSIPVRAADGTLADQLQEGAPAQAMVAGGHLQLALPAQTAAIYR
jgi:glycosidase